MGTRDPVTGWLSDELAISLDAGGDSNLFNVGRQRVSHFKSLLMNRRSWNAGTAGLWGVRTLAPPFPLSETPNGEPLFSWV